jgi:hypothetical protein
MTVSPLRSQVPTGTWLYRAYEALDGLDPMTASRSDIMQAVKDSWLNREPEAIGTIIGLWYERNETMIPDEIFVRVPNLPARGRALQKENHWKRLNDQTRWTWLDTARRAHAIREMEVKDS